MIQCLAASKITAAACFQLSISLENYPCGLEIIASTNRCLRKKKKLQKLGFPPTMTKKTFCLYL